MNSPSQPENIEVIAKKTTFMLLKKSLYQYFCDLIYAVVRKHNNLPLPQRQEKY